MPGCSVTLVRADIQLPSSPAVPDDDGNQSEELGSSDPDEAVSYSLALHYSCSICVFIGKSSHIILEDGGVISSKSNRFRAIIASWENKFEARG
jgi:hypothetical protein